MRTRWMGAIVALLLVLVGAAARGAPDEGRLSDEQRAHLEARIVELKAKAADAAGAGREQEAQAARREAEQLMAKLHAAAKAAKPHAKKEPPRGPKDLDHAAEELRARARELRERGSVEDAAFLEAKASRYLEARALRIESNELERRGKEVRAAGHEDDARRLFEESGRTWRRSEELLAGDAKPERREEPREAHGPDEHARRRLEHLRAAEHHAREAGSHDVADVLARQAEETERALRAGEGRAAELRELRQEVEALRRRVRELEEALARRNER